MCFKPPSLFYLPANFAPYNNTEFWAGSSVLNFPLTGNVDKLVAIV